MYFPGLEFLGHLVVAVPRTTEGKFSCSPPDYKMCFSSFVWEVFCIMLYTTKDAELEDIEICGVLEDAIHYVQNYDHFRVHLLHRVCRKMFFSSFV